MQNFNKRHDYVDLLGVIPLQNIIMYIVYNREQDSL